MNQTIQIQVQQRPQDLTIKEFQGKRVVTFKDIDELHYRPEGSARKRFNDNRHHFVEGEDYFVRNTDEARRELGIIAPNGLVVVTESGYLMLVKSFTDDLAWKVQRQLVNSYFRGQASQSNSLQSLLQATRNILAGQEIMAERLGDVENRLESQITLDSGQQRRLQGAINKKICGYEPNKLSRPGLFRQLHKEIKDRWNVPSYKDVLRHDLQDVLNYVAAWVPIHREE